MRQDRQPSLFNQQRKELDVNALTKIRGPLIICIAATMAGCVAPWAGQKAVDLPTVTSTPTTDRPTERIEPSDPNVALEIETVPNVASDAIIRGQSPRKESVLDGNDGLFRDQPSSSEVGAENTRVAQLTSPGASYSAYGPIESGNGGGYGAGEYGTTYGGYQDASSAQGQGYGPAYSTYDGSAVAQPYGGGPADIAGGLSNNPLPADYADLVVNLRENSDRTFHVWSWRELRFGTHRAGDYR